MAWTEVRKTTLSTVLFTKEGGELQGGKPRGRIRRRRGPPGWLHCIGPLRSQCEGAQPSGSSIGVFQTARVQGGMKQEKGTGHI